MSEGRSPERLCGAAACRRELMAKPLYSQRRSSLRITDSESRIASATVP
jgi:hypothetical protein